MKTNDTSTTDRLRFVAGRLIDDGSQQNRLLTTVIILAAADLIDTLQEPYAPKGTEQEILKAADELQKRVNEMRERAASIAASKEVAS